MRGRTRGRQRAKKARSRAVIQWPGGFSSGRWRAGRFCLRAGLGPLLAGGAGERASCAGGREAVGGRKRPVHGPSSSSPEASVPGGRGQRAFASGLALARGGPPDRISGWREGGRAGGEICSSGGFAIRPGPASGIQTLTSVAIACGHCTTAKVVT